jgi:hypothetical protein
MTRTRKTKLIAALVAALVGVQALAAPVVSVARSVPRPPSNAQLAVLPQPVRVRKQRRRAAGRTVRLRFLGRLRARQEWGRARGANPRQRLAMGIPDARGPPQRRR